LEEALGHSRSSHAWYLVGIAILAGLVIRFQGMGVHSLWVDEILTLLNSHIDEGLEANSLFHNLQGPMVSLLMHFWGKVVSTDALLRLPFAIVGALTVVATYRLARLIMDAWRSLHTVLFVSLSPLLIWYSHEIRGYAFVLLFTVLMTYYLIKWLEHPTRRSLTLYGICFLAALLSNLTAAFVGAAHFMYLIASPRRIRLLGRWVVAVLIVMLLFAPWIRTIISSVKPHEALAGETGPRPLGGAQLTPLVIPYLFYSYSVGYTLGPSTRELREDAGGAIRANAIWIVLTAVVFGIPVVAGFVSMMRNSPGLALLIILWLAVPIVAALGLAALNMKVFTPRYTFVALPAYAFLFGQGLSRFVRSHYWVVIIAVLCLWSISLINYYGNYRYAKDDARSAAQIIRKQYAPGDVILAVYSAEPLAYYLKGFAEVAVLRARDIVSPEAKVERCKEVAEQGRRVWLYLCREDMIDEDGYVYDWFESNLRRVSNFNLAGVKLYLFEKGSQ